MTAEPTVEAALPDLLAAHFTGAVTVERLALMAGGASKETWALDVAGPGGTRTLVMRRAGGGVIHEYTLPLRDEYRLIEVAHAAGVKVPAPRGYLPDVAGRPAFLAERVSGETVGVRVVRRPDLAKARSALPRQMADELVKLHDIPLSRVLFLPALGPEALIARLTEELDQVDGPHPVIELGLAWLREHRPAERTPVVVHGDFRVGNFVVGSAGLDYVLDWEFAHQGDAAEDLGLSLVRAWRFGGALPLAGIGEVEPYLERYVARTGRPIGLADLRYWEVVGNVKWAIGQLMQARRHLSGQQRSIELAVLGRLASDVEYELLTLVG